MEIGYGHDDLCLLNSCSSKHHKNSRKRFVRLSNSLGSVITLTVHEKGSGYALRADMRLSHSKRLGALQVNLIPLVMLDDIESVLHLIDSLREELNESLGTDFRLKGVHDGTGKKAE